MTWSLICFGYLQNWNISLLNHFRDFLNSLFTTLSVNLYVEIGKLALQMHMMFSTELGKIMCMPKVAVVELPRSTLEGRF